LRFGIEQINAHTRGDRVRRVKRVEALYELLKHELFDVCFVCVQDLIPDQEETYAVEFNCFRVAYVNELLNDAAYAATLPSQV